MVLELGKASQETKFNRIVFTTDSLPAPHKNM